MTWIIIKSFVIKYKYVFIAIGVVAALGGAFLLGRGTAPIKTVEVTKTVEVEKKVVEVQTQVVEKKIYVKAEAKDIHEVTTEIKKPDGTVITKTEVDDKTKTTEDDQSSTQEASSQLTEDDKEKSTETTKIVDNRKPDWHLALRGGAGLQLNAAPRYPIFDVGLSAERRIVGPFWLGIYSDVQMSAKPVPTSFIVGASVGLEF